MIRKRWVDGQNFTVYTICRSEREDSFVKQFVDELEASDQKKIVKLIRLAANHGPLRNPEKCLPIRGEKNLYELKEDFARIMFFYAGKGIMVLTHVFKKHSGPPLPVEIDRAKRLRDQYRLEYGNI